MLIKLIFAARVQKMQYFQFYESYTNWEPVSLLVSRTCGDSSLSFRYELACRVFITETAQHTPCGIAK